VVSPGTIESDRELKIQISPLRSVAENLKIDEAMTRTAAADGGVVLRLWWGDGPTVVVGRSEDPERVADLEACRQLGVDIIRRPSGGGTVLQTPGVLNYSLTAPAPVLLDIRALFSVGTRLLIATLARLGVVADARAVSDVAVADRKISGNAMAKRWGGVLLHGTLLYDLDMDLVERCLRHPPREPDYRRGRGHREFLTTLRAEGVRATPADLEASMVAAARCLWSEGTMASVLSAPR